MDLMYNYEGNLGEKNGSINPLFACRDKPMCLSVLEQAVFGSTLGFSFTGNTGRIDLISMDLICVHS
jgi:hypothetical protein